jgi:Uma2 family endonuclease
MFARKYDDEADHDNIVELRDVTWDDYERLLEIRGEKAVPRLTFLEGRLQIVSPSRSHERLKTWIARLVEVWCLERGIDFETTGSWTIKQQREERGAEPDESYVFGPDFETGCPHLAIEVIWSKGGIDKLEVYRRLGVRGVWIWRKGRITPYVLRGDRYVPLIASEVPPGIDLDQLVSFLDRPSTAIGIRDYRAALAATPRA